VLVGLSGDAISPHLNDKSFTLHVRHAGASEHFGVPKSEWRRKFSSTQSRGVMLAVTFYINNKKKVPVSPFSLLQRR
jgi:hypothetical protein